MSTKTFNVILQNHSSKKSCGEIIVLVAKMTSFDQGALRLGSELLATNLCIQLKVR